MLQGVFSVFDIKNLLRESKPALIYKHIAQLEKQKILTRFTRGYYVTPDFSLEVLSQRVCPQSYISCGNVLAKNLVIGSIPAKTITAIKIGKNKIYKSPIGTLVYFGIAPHLFFGFETQKGISFANKEKAFLDTLYFYQRGHKFSFNIFQDINIKSLDVKTIQRYLKFYKNPKVVKFVKGMIND